MNDIQPLTNLQCGQTARVGKLTLQGSMRRRLQDIGLIEGTQVECVQKSPAGDPVAYLIRGAVIALRCFVAERKDPGCEKIRSGVLGLMRRSMQRSLFSERGDGRWD